MSKEVRNTFQDVFVLCSMRLRYLTLTRHTRQDLKRNYLLKRMLSEPPYLNHQSHCISEIQYNSQFDMKSLDLIEIYRRSGHLHISCLDRSRMQQTAYLAHENSVFVLVLILAPGISARGVRNTVMIRRFRASSAKVKQKSNALQRACSYVTTRMLTTQVRVMKQLYNARHVTPYDEMLCLCYLSFVMRDNVVNAICLSTSTSHKPTRMRCTSLCM